MKTNIKIFLSALLLLTGACTELDEEPIGLLAPESFFKTAQDAEAAVLSGYGLMAREQYYGRMLPMTLQLLSDMATIGDQGTAASRRQLDGFIFDAGNNNIEFVWNSAYEIIGSANAAMEGIKLVEMDEAKRNALDAEARTIRALAYYHLVQLFGEVPLIDYFIDTPEEVEAVKVMAKSSVVDIYNLIIKDLEETYNALPNSYPGEIRSRATKGAALTLLASTHLTLGNWEKAAEYSQLVINNRGDYGYRLMDDYNDLWDATAGDVDEHIWTVDFLGQVTAPDKINADYTAAMTGVRGSLMEGWSVVVASPGVYDSFEDEDLRKSVTFITEWEHADGMRQWTEFQDPYIHTGKWCRFPGNSQSTGAISDHNYTVFRYAEVLLIAAEAINEAVGPTTEAYDYINEVRRRAGFTENLENLDQEAFRVAVRAERRLELAFEWKRWYDLKRWDMVQEAFTAADSFEPRTNVQAFHALLPIPQAELSRNENLLPQNTGY